MNKTGQTTLPADSAGCVIGELHLIDIDSKGLVQAKNTAKAIVGADSGDMKRC